MRTLIANRIAVVPPMVAGLSVLTASMANARVRVHDGSAASSWYSVFKSGATWSYVALEGGNSAIRIVDPASRHSRGCLHTYCSSSTEPAKVAATRLRTDSADTDWSTILCMGNSALRVALVLTKLGGIQRLALGQFCPADLSFRVVSDLDLVPYGSFRTAYLWVTQDSAKLRWEGVESTFTLPRPNYRSESITVEFGSASCDDRYYSPNASSAATMMFDYWVGAGYGSDCDAVTEPAGIVSLVCGVVGLIPVPRRRRV